MISLWMETLFPVWHVFDHFFPQLQQPRLPIKLKIGFVLLFAQWDTFALCTLVFLKKNRSLLIFFLCLCLPSSWAQDRRLVPTRPFVIPANAWRRKIRRLWHLPTKNKQCANREFPPSLHSTEIWIAAVVFGIIHGYCGVAPILFVFPESKHTSQLTFFIYSPYFIHFLNPPPSNLNAALP